MEHNLRGESQKVCVAKFFSVLKGVKPPLYINKIEMNFSILNILICHAIITSVQVLGGFKMLSDTKKIIRFGYRSSRPSLKESLDTSVYVCQGTFSKFLPQYNFYSFDDKCDQLLFILKPDLLNLTTLGRFWLFVEVQKYEN